MKLHLEETGTEYENFFAVIRQYLAENQASEQEIQRLKEQQEAEENGRRQALMEKEEADRIARQQAQGGKGGCTSADAGGKNGMGELQAALLRPDFSSKPSRMPRRSSSSPSNSSHIRMCRQRQ